MAMTIDDALLRLAVDTAANGLVLVDAAGQIVFANRQAEVIFGYGAGELIDRPLSALVPVGAREIHHRHHESYVAHPEPRIMGKGRDLWGLRRDGDEVPLEIGLSFIPHPGGPYVLASVVDLTERRRAEASVRWLSLAVEQGPTSVVMTDMAGNIEYVNAKFTEVTGYTLDDVRGKNPRILKSGETPAAVYRDLWATINAGRQWYGEVLNRKKDGTTYWDAMWVYPIRDGGGAITRFLAIKEDISERKHTEQALQERDERFRQLADNIKEVFFLQNADYSRTIYINKAYEEIWGQSREALYDDPQSFINPIPEEDRGALFASIERSRRGEYAGDVEFRVVRPDGEVRWMLAHAVPVRNAAGDVYRIAGVCTDVTERKEREDYYRTILENIGDAVFIADATGRYREVNPRACELTGYSREELLRLEVTDTYPDDDREAGRRRVTEVGRGEPTVFERRLRRKDGSLLTVEVNAQVLPDGRLLATMRDTTERHRAEDALRESEQRARTLFETVNLIVLGLNAHGGVDYVNPFFLATTGFSREDVFGKEWFQFVPARDRLTLQSTFHELLEANLHLHNENPILTKTGEERLIAWNNTVVRDAAGRATGTLSIGEDITERSKLEVQLRQAQKMEAVGRLAGGVAHDFNNVLTAVFGYVDLLREELPADSDAQEDLAQVRKAAERAAGLTRQLLAFSRQQVLEPIVLGLNDLVEDFEKMLRRVIGEDVELRLSLGEDVGNVLTDPGQMNQVIMNLVVNARDAMPTGGKLTIETESVDLTEEYAELHPPVTPGPYVMLAVSDTGTGMTPEVRARIFEPFFTTKEKGKGTGLGLSTVYGIVKQSGGYIWAYSEPGRGTTFKIYLPRKDAPAASLAKPTDAVRLTGSETILIAEDDSILRPLARQLLGKLGYKVLEGEDAETALAVAEAHPGPIHLLVADVVMPGPSGRDLARRLAESRPETKVLYVSGYTDDAIVHHGMLEPGLNFLQKPFTPGVLARKVREVLDK